MKDTPPGAPAPKSGHGGARPGAGRPGRPEQLRSQKMRLSLTPLEEEEIYAAAKAADLPAATWARESLLARARTGPRGDGS